MSEKDGFPFYMEKEMAEQPRVIARMLEKKNNGRPAGLFRGTGAGFPAYVV